MPTPPSSHIDPPSQLATHPRPHARRRTHMPVCENDASFGVDHESRGVLEGSRRVFERTHQAHSQHNDGRRAPLDSGCPLVLGRRRVVISSSSRRDRGSRLGLGSSSFDGGWRLDVQLHATRRHGVVRHAYTSCRGQRSLSSGDEEAAGKASNAVVAIEGRGAAFAIRSTRAHHPIISRKCIFVKNIEYAEKAQGRVRRPAC